MESEDAASARRVSGYEVVLPLVRSESISVYLARAGSLGDGGRYVALQIAEAHAPDLAEARFLLGFRHPNVVPIYDVGDEDRGMFVASDYVPGESLSALQALARDAGEPLAQRISLRILVDALHGLSAVHEFADAQGSSLQLFHRDWSARKLLVGTDGVARVTGFGIAWAEPRTHVAPELARGASLDRRTDVWNVAAIAWEVLAERELPNTAEPPRLGSEVDGGLAEAVARALRPDPDARTATAEAFARALESAASAVRLLAERHEVAACVGRLAGPALAARRATLARARRKERDSTPDVRAMVGVRPPPPEPDPLPSIPEVPVPPLSVPRALRSELGIEVDLQKVPQERVSEAILGPAAAPPPLEEPPEVFRSPVAAPPSIFRRGWDALHAFARPPWSTPKKIAGVALASLSVLALLALLVSRGQDESSTPSDPTTLAPATAPADEPPPSDDEAPTVVPTAPAMPDRAPSALAMLRIQANAPIASIRLGDRVVDSIVATPSVAVDVAEAESGARLHVVATATDGRTASADADPGVEEITLAFGTKPPAARAPAPQPKQKDIEKRTWPKRSPRSER